MRRILLFSFLLGCSGPSQQQLAETPSATSRQRAVEAPPASTSDRDRERAVQQFDDMQTTQNAYSEANRARSAGSGSGQGSAEGQGSAATKKKGPAEQGYLPKDKK